MKIHKDCKIELATSKSMARKVISEPYLDMKEKPVMVATNGAIMAIVPVEVGADDVAGHVGVGALKLMRKSKREEAAVTKDFVEIDGVGKVLRPDLGQFPNWRLSLPEKDRETVFEVGISVKMLWELCQAIGCETARLKFANNLDGIIVEPTSSGTVNYPAKPAANPDAYGVIMPTRLS